MQIGHEFTSANLSNFDTGPSVFSAEKTLLSHVVLLYSTYYIRVEEKVLKRVGVSKNIAPCDPMSAKET